MRLIVAEYQLKIFLKRHSVHKKQAKHPTESLKSAIKVFYQFRKRRLVSFGMDGACARFLPIIGDFLFRRILKPENGKI